MKTPFLLFREALAWGQVYGPIITASQWAEMRDKTALRLEGDMLPWLTERSNNHSQINQMRDALQRIGHALDVAEGRLVEVLPKVEQIKQKAEAWDALIELCGHVQDGSDTVVTLSQDDATRTCFIRVGKKSYFGLDGGSFLAAVAEATKGEQA